MTFEKRLDRLEDLLNTPAYSSEPPSDFEAARRIAFALNLGVERPDVYGDAAKRLAMILTGGHRGASA